MSYTLSFDPLDDLLLARVGGARPYFVDDMVTASQSAWQRIAQVRRHCEARGLLVLWDVTGPLSSIAAACVGRALLDLKVASHLPIAHVERDPQVLRTSELAVRIAAAGGMQVRAFPAMRPAVEWLREETRA